MKILATLLLVVVSTPVFAGATAWIPFEVHNGHIYFPITINGQPANAMLDSGAEGNAVSTVFLEKHGLDYKRGRPITLLGIHGEVHTNYVDDIQLGIFGSEFEVDDLLPMEFDDLDFIVGLPFFYQFVVQIDYPGKRMRVITHDSIKMKKFSNVKMKHVANSVQPMVRVDLNGEFKPWLILDTGSNSGVYIQRLRAEKHGWLEAYATESAGMMGISGAAMGTEQFRLPTMTIGPFTLENVMVIVPQDGGTINLQQFRPDDWSTGTKIKRSKSADGILGYDVLRHFIVTIDLKREYLNLDVPR